MLVGLSTQCSHVVQNPRIRKYIDAKYVFVENTARSVMITVCQNVMTIKTCLNLTTGPYKMWENIFQAINCDHPWPNIQ